MIFLILPVWWVPCVLVPILPVVSPWCLGGAPGEPPQRTHEFLTPKDDRVNSILNMKKTRFKSEVLFHILFRCFSLKEIFSKHAQHCAYTLLLKTPPTKKTCFIGKPSSTPTSTRSVVPDRFMLSALMGSYEKASFIRRWPRKPSHEPKLWCFKFKGFWTR